MLDVIIALVPACIAAVHFFGESSVTTIILCIISAVGCEALMQFVMKRSITLNDLSAVVTGLLMALILPPNMPWYIPVCGAAFAIIIVKQLFGGIGYNFVNPALAGRCFLLISWASAMSIFTAPLVGADIVTSATPLAAIGDAAAQPELVDLFVGRVSGSIGETSVIALLIGAAYLLIRKVISIHIPAAYLATVAVMSLLISGPQSVLYNIFAGGLMLGAFFMATDYATSPTGKKAQVIFGAGCGVVTIVIRIWGGSPEGVAFAILFMNLFVPLLDKVFRNKAFGETRNVQY